MPETVLIRQVRFSSGHRFWLEHLSAEQNQALFGPIASPYNHGHNYVLWVSASGTLDERTGMVVNIKTIDDELQSRVVQRLNMKSLNDEVPELTGKAPCLENLLEFFWADLSAPGALPPEVRLTALRLEEMPTLWAEKTLSQMTLSRSYEFAASHRLHAPALSDEENRRLFGKCNNPNGHGHNYVVEVSLTGDPDPQTGMILDLASMDASVERLILDRYDHKNLDLDCPEFAGRATTSEVLAAEIFRRLKEEFGSKLASIKLYETPRSAFEVRAG